MRLLNAFLAFGIVSANNAQLINGSFEDNGTFSLQGWEWVCVDPQGTQDVPIGGGIWSAWKQPGHAKGCFPSLLYQRITDVQYGIPYQLSGWVKCPQTDLQFCLGASIAFGVINNGNIIDAGFTTSNDTGWTFLTTSHVFDPGIGDTAIVILSAGFTGGPMNPVPAGFDQFTLDIATGLGEGRRPIVNHYPDPVVDVLHIGIADGRINAIDLLDEAGRTVLTTAGGTGTRQVPVVGLPPGTYFGRVSTDQGERRFSFVKR